MLALVVLDVLDALDALFLMVFLQVFFVKSNVKLVQVHVLYVIINVIQITKR